MGVLFVTGLLLAPTTLNLKLDVETPWRLEADRRIQVAALHAFFAFGSLVVLGALSSIHMRQEWRRGNNRASGLILVAIFGFLTLTGLGIYYFGDEGLSAFSSLSHLAVGVFIALIYLWHILWFKSQNKKSSDLSELIKSKNH